MADIDTGAAECECALCESSPPGPNDKIVRNQTEASDLPNIINGNLFVKNVTNASITIPSTSVTGSVFVSGITVNNGSVQTVTFPNLTSAGCDVVVGRDTISPDSNLQVRISGAGSKLSIVFGALATIGGNLVLGTAMRPGSPVQEAGISLLLGSQLLIEFSALKSVCGNVIVGKYGDASFSAITVSGFSVLGIAMKGPFCVHGSVAVGVYNPIGTTNATFGNAISSGSRANISVGCETVDGLLVCGRLGRGDRGNAQTATGEQTIEFPLLVDVKDQLVMGVMRGRRPPEPFASVAANFSSPQTRMTVSCPILSHLTGSLVIGALESERDIANRVDENATQSYSFSALHTVDGDLTLGDGANQDPFKNVALSGVQTVDLGNLRHVGGDLTITRNLLDTNGLSRYDLHQVCSVGAGFQFSSNERLNFNGLLWSESRPLQCIGGPLLVELNRAADPSLVDVDGLSSLACLSVDKSVVVRNNQVLTLFCGLYQLSTDPDVQFTISGNAANPTKAEIEAGGPCPGADLLQPTEPCFGTITCPPDITLPCYKSTSPFNTGYPTSTDPGAVFVYVDVVIEPDYCKGFLVERRWSDARCCADSCTQMIAVARIGNSESSQ